MAPPPRPFLSREEMSKLSEQEKAVAIAEWSSYIRGRQLEQERLAARGAYGWGRGRGRGRGRGYHAAVYHPYPRPQPAQPTFPFHHSTATFNRDARPTGSAVAAAATTAPHIAADNSKTSKEHSAEPSKPCAAFTSTGNRQEGFPSPRSPGICKRSRCANIHDPDKTAICRQFLFKGDCAKGRSCPLSHEPSANRSPHCIHFQNDHCNKNDCRYAHVHVSEDAPVCEAFARLGYCEKGDQCADRHAFECPDFANKGTCDVNGCRLPHIKHAGRLRKARMSSEPQSEPGSPDTEDDTAKHFEQPDNVDQDHAMTQQADFIPLES